MGNSIPFLHQGYQNMHSDAAPIQQQLQAVRQLSAAVLAAAVAADFIVPLAEAGGRHFAELLTPALEHWYQGVLAACAPSSSEGGGPPARSNVLHPPQSLARTGSSLGLAEQPVGSAALYGSSLLEQPRRASAACEQQPVQPPSAPAQPATVSSQSADAQKGSADDSRQCPSPASPPACKHGQDATEAAVSEPDPRHTMLAALQAAAWEQLHTGHWKDVAVGWRDAYSVTCFAQAVQLLLRGFGATANPASSQPTAAGKRLLDLKGDQSPAGGTGSVPVCADASSPAGASHVRESDVATNTAQQHAPPTRSSNTGSDSCGRDPSASLKQVLHELDMAVLMGGPRVRPQVDALLDIAHQLLVSLGSPQQQPASHQVSQSAGEQGRQGLGLDAQLADRCDSGDGQHGMQRQQPSGPVALAADDTDIDTAASHPAKRRRVDTGRDSQPCAGNCAGSGISLPPGSLGMVPC